MNIRLGSHKNSWRWQFCVFVSCNLFEFKIVLVSTDKHRRDSNGLFWFRNYSHLIWILLPTTKNRFFFCIFNLYLWATSNYSSHFATKSYGKLAYWWYTIKKNIFPSNCRSCQFLSVKIGFCPIKCTAELVGVLVTVLSEDDLGQNRR